MVAAFVMWAHLICQAALFKTIQRIFYLELVMIFIQRVTSIFPLQRMPLMGLVILHQQASKSKDGLKMVITIMALAGM